MTSRVVGRLQSQVLRRKCRSSLSGQVSKYATRQYTTQPTHEGQAPASSSALSSLHQDRDPSLPPKPPAGTYPHPFPNSRDDPHSNSMRLSYRYPPSMSQKNWPGGLGRDPLSRRAALEELNSIPRTDVESSDAPPLYVIHVKASSNNTIITLNAPTTPKSQILSSNLLGRASASRSAVLSPAPFSVESNPDAAPREQDEKAFESTQGAKLGAEPLDAPQDGPVKSPIPAELQSSPTFTSRAANRCIGWASGGSCHYKKVKRGTYEAGYAASVGSSGTSIRHKFS